MSTEIENFWLFLHLGRAIEASLGQDAGLATDIIFFAHEMKNEAFNLGEFCSKRNYSEHALSETHRLFRDREQQAPLIDGHRFSSAFDYCLLSTLRSQFVFGGPYPGRQGLIANIAGLVALESVEVCCKAEIIEYNIQLSNILKHLLAEPSAAK